MARGTLTKDAILDAAVALADAEGLEALSMRRLGTQLGVEAMSLYNHVANKDELLRGIVDRVWAALDLALDEPDWRVALHRLCGSGHRAMLAHRWFFQLPVAMGGPARMRVIDATLAHLDHGRIPDELAFHALHVLDGHVFGYTWQDLGFTGVPTSGPAVEEAVAQLDAANLPHLVAHAMQHVSNHPPGDGFVVGLDLLLDGLARSQNGAPMYVTQTLETPDGPFTIIERGGVVVGAGWTGSVDEVATRSGIQPDAVAAGSCTSASAVLAYYAGDSGAVASVPVAPQGTEFRERVWEVLRTIPAGETRTYGEVAAELGTPSASRAVGAACGANVVALFVPCHRVMGASGALTGFAWGVETKKSLLGREGSLARV
ncbi:methylated-DNA--[protein]-cysteine S-methyltransferase [Demequina sp.]|uniref:methylated-DNA--[protein]-cysteine S-methyltransferase n=1 Tax=Demequina sp. TaxID=2050685 RepID=UPI003D0BDB2D